MAVGCHRLKIRVVIVEQLEVDRLHILPCIKIHGDLLFHEMASLCRKVVSKTTSFLLFKSIKNLDFMGSCK